MQHNTVYRPSGAVSKAFMKSDAFVRGIMGPFGSGKSTACIYEILRRAAAQKQGSDGKRRSRWAIIRNTYPELRTTTIKSWHQHVPPQVGRWVDSGPPMHHIQSGDLDLEIIFLALDRPDDIAKLLSMELTGAWINECREVPRAVVDGLTGRVGRYPSVLLGGCSWSGIIMDTNPPDSDHWYYTLAEEVKPEGWEFFKQPSGMAEDAENIANLPPNYYARQMAGKDEDWVKVYIHGEYGYVREGKPVYGSYRDSTHCAEFDMLLGQPIYVGIDFGLTPAAAFAQRKPMGGWLIFDELVAQDMGAVRFSELLHEKLFGQYSLYPIGQITGDPAGDSRAQTDERTPFQILRANGIDAKPATTNDPIARIESVRSSLERMIDGYAGLQVHPRCKQIRQGFMGGYCYRRLQVSGEEKYRDVPDKNHYSHVHDALQYLFIGAGEGKLLIGKTPSNRKFRQDVAISDYAIV